MNDSTSSLALPLREPTPLNSGVKVQDEYQFLSFDTTRLKINIHHPGYPNHHDLLFSLYAWDSSSTAGGLHYGLAHDACAIIADNHLDGYLSSTREGDHIVRMGLDEILPAGDYWFFVPYPQTLKETPITPYRWPVVASFQDWVFPNSLPAVWSRIQTSQVNIPPQNTGPQSLSSAPTRSRDQTCRITNHSTGTQAAHLCPEHEREWFIGNTMANWNKDTSLDTESLMNDLSNTILLRSDLHAAFDRRQFVFYPKSSEKLVVHMLQSTTDIGQLYHNAKTYPIDGCGLQFLYARFAWAIFPLIAGFLSQASRTIIGVQIREGQRSRVIEELSTTTLRGRATASRSNSPKKRSRNTTLALQDKYGLDFGAASPSSKRRRIRQRKSITTQTSASDDALVEPLTPLEQQELEDTQLRRIFDEATGTPESLLPPSKYPGWKEIEQLREQALAKQRPPGFVEKESNR